MSKENSSYQPEQTRTPKEYRNKIYFLKQFNTAEVLPTGANQKLMENPLTIATNSERLRQEPIPKALSLQNSDDPFHWQTEAQRLATTIMQDTKQPDMVDLLCGLREGYRTIGNWIIDQPASPALGKRINQLSIASVQHLIYKFHTLSLRDFTEFNLSKEYQKVFDTEFSEWTALAGPVLANRFEIGNLIEAGELMTPQNIKQETKYNKPLHPKELNKLNNAAADTIERLHLLKAYGISSFEVDGNKIGLPWDIAVVPPIEPLMTGDNVSLDNYASGAVADFMFLKPNPERANTLFETRRSEDPKVTNISIGGQPSEMRFRLHDNGQISHGHMYHNIPSDLTEDAFNDYFAPHAFAQLRGLFIALAFDALVPTEVISGQHVRGSVASNFDNNPNDPSHKQITDLLLQRAKALRTANVNERNREPRGWSAPQSPVRGYIKRLPEGTKARPQAEHEAREYYESINVRFDGLPEGYNFTKPHTRGTDQERVPYRKAKFRKDSATAVFLKEQQ